MADLARIGDQEIRIVDPTTQVPAIVTSEGELSVTIGQHVKVSSSNNTTTPLTANSVFTGTGESTLNVAGIRVTCFSDVSSIHAGLSIQQSINGTNWDIVDKCTVIGGVGYSITVQSTASFFRVVYTNGPTNQTVFRLQVTLCPVIEALPRKPKCNGSLSVSPRTNPTFVATAGDVAIGNNKSMISLVLATASPYVIRVREIYIKNTQTAAVTGVIARFALRKITGHSGGTLITASERNVANPLPSDVTVRTNSTVSGESSAFLDRWSLSSDDWGSGTLDVEAMQAIMTNLMPVYACKNTEETDLTLSSGEGLTLKCETNSTAGIFDIVVVFTVETE